MWIDVTLGHASVRNKRPKVWIAVDVLRATSVMTVFLAEGGRKLYMTGDVKEAFALQRGLKLLAIGEQFAKPIPGFDFDNSPLQLLQAKQKLQGRSGVHCTSNGTKLVKLLTPLGGTVIAGSFLNLSACTAAAVRMLGDRSLPEPDFATLEEEASDGIASDDREGIVIACSGRSAMPILDDTYLAGAFVESLHAQLPQAELRDGAKIALAVRQALTVEEAFRTSESGIVMAELGLQDDILFCARQDVYTCVPRASFEGDHLVMTAATLAASSPQAELATCVQNEG